MTLPEGDELLGDELPKGDEPKATTPEAESPPAEPSRAASPKSSPKSSPVSKALAKAPATARDQVARVTLIAAAALAALGAVVAPFEVPLIAETKLKGALVAFFAGLSVLLALRALLLRRRSPLATAPALIAVVAAALALTAAGFLAFQERGAVLDSPDGHAHAADLVAWELGRGQQRSRDLALSGGLALPGFALGALALGLGIGARRRAGAALEKDAADPKAAKGKRRKMIAAGWSALLFGAAIFAAGLAVDALAVAAPVDLVAHPRVASLGEVREHLSKAHVEEACGVLESVLADKTPPEIVRAELPDVEEIAQRCVGHAIERLPKGMSCVERAAKLAAGETVKLIHAEDRAKSACDRALIGD